MAFGRNDTRPGGELDVIAALFGADSLLPPEEGGDPLATVVGESRQHAVGVSSELREGLRLSVELIANEVLARIREHGRRPGRARWNRASWPASSAGSPCATCTAILFLLYAEARPELGVLPVDDPDYVNGYSMPRLGELVSRKLGGEQARQGFHLYESLDLLFRMVNDGHRPARQPRRSTIRPARTRACGSSRCDPTCSCPRRSSSLDGRASSTPTTTAAPVTNLDRHPAAQRTLYQVLRLLMLTRGKQAKSGAASSPTPSSASTSSARSTRA